MDCLQIRRLNFNLNQSIESKLVEQFENMIFKNHLFVGLETNI